MSDRKIAIALYVLCTAVYAAVAGQRLLHPSADTHFVYQAESFLKHRLDIGGSPPHTNDWAEVETVTLHDGTKASGHFLRSSPGRFRLLDGRIRPLADADIASRSRKYYVSFPPFPAVLMLPLVALFGHRTNDVLFTVLFAGIAPALLFLLLRRLPQHLAGPAEPDTPPFELQASLWLTALFAFGSSYFFCSVLGQVWFTAHVVSLALCAIYLWALMGPLRPGIAGLCLGAIFLTRPQMAALGLLFLAELLRRHHPQHRYPRRWVDVEELASVPLRRLLWPLFRFALPSAGLAALGLFHNHLRFGKLFEFGHTYLTTMQADNIQRFGLFNYQYLPRNLASALALLPKILATAPYVQISYHGLALWFTTPALFCLLWPQAASVADAQAASHPVEQSRQSLVSVLLWSVLPIAVADLLYQNTGYVQFGYRFSLDYMLPLLLLLALTQSHRLCLRRPGEPERADLHRRRRLLFRVLVVWGVLVNLFGAITFSRFWQFYFNGFFPVS